MAREGLRFELGSAFQKALRQKEAITVKGLKVGTNGGTQTVDITVQAIEEPEALRGMVMIVFTDVATPPEKKATGRSRTSSGRQRQGSRTGAGTPAGPRRTADHPRGDAILAGRAQIHQRGAAVHQRGAAVHQRGTDHLPGRDAVPERRAADGERRAAVQNGRAFAGEQRHEEPAQQHGNSHRVPGQRAPCPALHHRGGQTLQADPGRCGAAAFRHRQRPALSRR